ncbi:MAG: hypothetical protein AAGI52_08950 [Bacteroidota bacterium]
MPRALVFLLVLSLAACDSPSVQPPDSQAADLPLLAPGRTLGTTLYGSADLDALGDAERQLLQDAIDTGLGGFAFYVDWADLEPTEGTYTLDAFTATLDALQTLGLAPFVNLTVGDSEGYNLPPGLGDGEGGIADGVALDDPEVIERFGRVLDRAVPVLLARGGFFLGLGNEMDGFLDPDRREREAYAAFVEAARERIHAMEPRLGVGVTLTGGAVRDQSPTYRAMRSVSDHIAINYGPIDPDFLVIDPGDIRAHYRDHMATYGDGPILIQELTCPSPETMGASEAWQNTCFELLLDEIENDPRVRFASVFTFQDFDEATCEIIREALFGDELDDLPPEIAERLTDYLCGLGVVRPDGTPKPAWQTIVGSLAE